jgi:GAF domain-containing protein
VVSDGRAAGGTGARRAPPGGRRRRTEKPPSARLQAELAAARKRIAGLEQQAEERERRLADALAQQTATAEVLRVVADAPADLQRALDLLAESAARLLGATSVWLSRIEDGRNRHAAVYPPTTEMTGRGAAFDADSVVGRAQLERRTVHVPDLAEDAAAATYPRTAPAARRLGFRAVLCAPLVRGGEALGALVARRVTPGPFSDQQIALAEAFADQAVIALENARLFRELQDRNQALSEALEQQTATAEILQAISRSPTDVQAVLDAVVVSASRLCESWPVAVLIREGDRLRRRAQANERGGAVQHEAPVPSWTEGLPIVPGWLAGRAVLEGRTLHVPDMGSPEGDAYPVSQEMARAAGWRTMVAIPLLQRGDAVGVLYVVRREARPFSDQEIALLQTFADQAAIAIENARLFTELREQLDQQTATGEVLAAISRAPTDLQRVLDTIADSAARLCGTDRAVIVRVEGDSNRGVAGLTVDDVRPTLESGPAVAQERLRSASRSRTAWSCTPPTWPPCPSRSCRSLAFVHGGCAPCWRCRCSGRAPRSGRSSFLGGRCAPSPTGRSPWSRPSPTRRSSPWRTPGCSRSCGRASGNSRRWAR